MHMFPTTALACLALSTSFIQAAPFLTGRDNNMDPSHDHDWDHYKEDESYSSSANLAGSAVETASWTSAYPAAASPSVVLVDDVVISTNGPFPPALQNTLLPTPVADNSTVTNTDGVGDVVIVVPVDTTSLSFDNDDGSKIASTGSSNYLASLSNPQSNLSFRKTFLDATIRISRFLGGASWTFAAGGLWEEYVWLTPVNVRHGEIGDC
ncbi:hypothetical protein QFC22_005668 [Naganishia vaughanmartiniae]|uniref:Uncharacterized protein n=1 Tax=Naganishia vaughanmartiniae TaxID=1424756 RepID=A0ACC2WS28_9TREE|nr:hypothetical protein QFC22_005668 [Naganishia vaughanmartiniae]